MRLDGCGGIVEGVCVLGRLSLQLTLVGERTRSTIAEEAIVADKLDIVT